MAYDVTGLRNAAQINVCIASDGEGVGFKFEMGWMWIILILLVGALYALGKYLNFSLA